MGRSHSNAYHQVERFFSKKPGGNRGISDEGLVDVFAQSGTDFSAYAAVMA
jgi:hypothetical protein